MLRLRKRPAASQQHMRKLLISSGGATLWSRPTPLSQHLTRLPRNKKLSTMLKINPEPRRSLCGRLSFSFSFFFLLSHPNTWSHFPQFPQKKNEALNPGPIIGATEPETFYLKLARRTCGNTGGLDFDLWQWRQGRRWAVIKWAAVSFFCTNIKVGKVK